MKKVFFYGLFMDPDCLKEMGYKPKNVQLVCLAGHQLVIGEKASLLPKADAKAFGTTMDLSSDELTQLYAGEGVQDYISHVVQVIAMTGETHDVLCYILPIDKIVGSNSEYANKLAEVAKKLNLPADYTDEIMSWV